MKQIKILTLIALLTGVLTSCDDTRSYAEMLTEENDCVNVYLANHHVIGSIPTDSVFIEGENAPYYQLDTDGYVYMQVISKGDMSLRPAKDDKVYFRFMRYPLSTYPETETLGSGQGNAEDTASGGGIGATFFLYDNPTSTNSYKYGQGLQLPMRFLGANAKVNLVVKSRMGWTAVQGNVIPFLYTVRYFSSPMSPWASEVAEQPGE